MKPLLIVGVCLFLAIVPALLGGCGADPLPTGSRERIVAEVAVRFHREVRSDRPDTVWIKRHLSASEMSEAALFDSRALGYLRTRVEELPQRGGPALTIEQVLGVQFLAADPDFAEVGVPGGCFHFVYEDGEWKYRGQFNE